MNVLLFVAGLAYMLAALFRVVHKILEKPMPSPVAISIWVGILAHLGAVILLFFGGATDEGFPTRGALMLAAGVLAIVCLTLETTSEESFFSIFVLPIVTILLGFASLTTHFLEGALFQGTWFFLHICASLMGECFFLMAAVSAGTYLFMVRKLKGKNRLRAIHFFPPLARLEHFTVLFLRSGVISFALGLSIGAYGWIGAFGMSGMLGVRRVLSGLLLAFFILLLAARHKGWLVGSRLSLLTIVGFVASLSLVFISRATHWMP